MHRNRQVTLLEYDMRKAMEKTPFLDNHVTGPNQPQI